MIWLFNITYTLLKSELLISISELITCFAHTLNRKFFIQVDLIN